MLKPWWLVVDQLLNSGSCKNQEITDSKNVFSSYIWLVYFTKTVGQHGMDGSVLEKKSSLKMLGLSFSSILDCGYFIISIAKTASKKIGALICSMEFLSPEVVLYLYKSIIRPCKEYCSHVWDGAPTCYFELLDKLQKCICGTIGPLLAASFKPLTDRRNVASLAHILLMLHFCTPWNHQKTEGFLTSSGGTEM